MAHFKAAMKCSNPIANPQFQFLSLQCITVLTVYLQVNLLTPRSNLLISLLSTIQFL